MKAQAAKILAPALRWIARQIFVFLVEPDWFGDGVCARLRMRLDRIVVQLEGE